MDLKKDQNHLPRTAVAPSWMLNNVASGVSEDDPRDAQLQATNQELIILLRGRNQKVDLGLGKGNWAQWVTNALAGSFSVSDYVAGNHGGHC